MDIVVVQSFDKREEDASKFYSDEEE